MLISSISYESLIYCLRVSKTFSNTVLASPSCRQTLWLDDKIELIDYADCSNQAAVELHPVLANIMTIESDRGIFRYGVPDKAWKFGSKLEFTQHSTFVAARCALPERWKDMPLSRPPILPSSGLLVESVVRCTAPRCAHVNSSFNGYRIQTKPRSLFDFLEILAKDEVRLSGERVADRTLPKKDVRLRRFLKRHSTCFASDNGGGGNSPAASSLRYHIQAVCQVPESQRGPGPTGLSVSSFAAWQYNTVNTSGSTSNTIGIFR